MVSGDRISYLISTSKVMYHEYIALEEVRNEFRNFFNKHTSKEVVLIPENVDVRYDLKLEVELYIMRNTIAILNDPILPVGRYDVYFDTDDAIIDEIFDLFELRC